MRGKYINDFVSRFLQLQSPDPIYEAKKVTERHTACMLATDLVQAAHSVQQLDLAMECRLFLLRLLFRFFELGIRARPVKVWKRQRR